MRPIAGNQRIIGTLTARQLNQRLRELERAGRFLTTDYQDTVDELNRRYIAAGHYNRKRVAAHPAHLERLDFAAARLA